MKTWLVLDCSYLAWRAAHTTGELSYRGVGTGVIYGLLREIVNLRDTHDTDRFVFCFDSKRKDLLRMQRCPEYKAHRDKSSLDEELRAKVHKQLFQLRTQVLPDLGFKNILYEKGFEADDLVASVVDNLPNDHKAIIVARDGDYYQLLGPRCIIWNPNKAQVTTAKSFSQEYGIGPSQWADVKAIAGCSSDNIKGVRGVGEKTAAKFLNGKLKSTSVAHISIVKNKRKVWDKNLPLVLLPYRGTPIFKLRKDKFNHRRWQRVCRRFGFRSLLGGFDVKVRQSKKKREAGQRLKKGFQL